MEASAIDHEVVLDDEYVVEDKLGGTTGALYRGRSKRDGRVVVVRRFSITSQPLAAEFLTLAQTASRVRHPGLASVEAYGRDGTADGYFLVSEYVSGQSLENWADEVGIPPLGQVIELVRRLCLGLQAAARSGVTHDALNPRNVLVTEAQGTGPRLPIKLLDLGVPAFLRAAEPGGYAVRFMSPEQLQAWSSPELAQNFRCSAVMNVYSCGCLLYFLCTGGPPYAGSSVEELLAAQSAGRLAPPVRINPQISPAFNGLILRALALAPAERFASVGDLADALASVVGSLSPFIRASSASTPSMRAVPAAATIVPEEEEPPTFKTQRPAELRVDVPDSTAHEVPTLPPSPPSPAEMTAFAPIGLFSSAPPWQERRSPPPPAFSVTGERAPPLALFSQPPGPALPPSDEHASIVTVQVEPVPTHMLVPYDLVAPVRAQRKRGLASGLVWPLAVLACLGAYFGVRLWLSSPTAPIAVGPAANSVASAEPIAQVNAAPVVANSGERPASEPEHETGAVRPDNEDQFAPSPALPQLASVEHSREHSHSRPRSHEARPTNNAEHPANVEAKEAVRSEPAAAEAAAPEPVAHEADASTRERLPEKASDKLAGAEATALKSKPKPDKSREPALPLQAKAQILAVEVHGSLPTSLVRRAVERIRAQLSACYARSALAAGHNGFGEVLVTVQLDEHGRAKAPHAHGGSLPQLDACVADAATKLISEKAPDTGTVSASWKVAFTP